MHFFRIFFLLLDAGGLQLLGRVSTGHGRLDHGHLPRFGLALLPLLGRAELVAGLLLGRGKLECHLPVLHLLELGGHLALPLGLATAFDGPAALVAILGRALLLALCCCTLSAETRFCCRILEVVLSSELLTGQFPSCPVFIGSSSGSGTCCCCSYASMSYAFFCSSAGVSIGDRLAAGSTAWCSLSAWETVAASKCPRRRNEGRAAFLLACSLPALAAFLSAMLADLGSPAFFFRPSLDGRCSCDASSCGSCSICCCTSLRVCCDLGVCLGSCHSSSVFCSGSPAAGNGCFSVGVPAGAGGDLKEGAAAAHGSGRH